MLNHLRRNSCPSSSSTMRCGTSEAWKEAGWEVGSLSRWVGSRCLLRVTQIIGVVTFSRGGEIRRHSSVEGSLRVQGNAGDDPGDLAHWRCLLLECEWRCASIQVYKRSRYDMRMCAASRLACLSELSYAQSEVDLREPTWSFLLRFNEDSDRDRFRRVSEHPVRPKTASGARSQARSSPTDLPRDLCLCCSFIKSTQRHIIVAERRASLRDCAQRSSAVFDQVVSWESRESTRL